MPYCSNCGTQNLETAKFCASCGAALQTAAGEQKPVPSFSTASPVIPSSGIGSKVSFIAGDGKAYTGTVKEIQGEQYKIKYDAFDFESWLQKDQFTVLTGNIPPPVYSSAPQNFNPQSTFSSTSASSTPAFLSHPGFWGSLLIIIGFFTNWINYVVGITGLRILTSAPDIIDQDRDGTGVAMVVALSVIILSAVICLFYTIGAGLGRGVFSVFKLLPLLSIIGLVVYIIIKAQENKINYEGDNASAWKILGIGIYLTLIGSIVLAVSKSRRK